MRLTSPGRQSERAKQGFLELESLCWQAAKGVRPVDSSYVEFWRLMLRYPERWHGRHGRPACAAQKAIYDRVKGINLSSESAGMSGIWVPSIPSIVPVESCGDGSYSDFLKIVMYQNCAGERMSDYINSVGTSYFSDIEAELLEFTSVLDYGKR